MAETEALDFVGGRRDQYGPDPRKVPPAVTNVDASEYDVPGVDGTIPTWIVVHFEEPRGWGRGLHRIWVEDTGNDPGTFICVAEVCGPFAIVQHPILVAGGSYEIYVGSVSGDGRATEPPDAPSDTITLTGFGAGLGPVPPDVTAFAGDVECCGIRFTWTAIAADFQPYIRHFEIRQGASYAAGTTVARVAPGQSTTVFIPREFATGSTFHIKAVGGGGVESAAEDTYSLTAIELACLVDCVCPLAPIDFEGYVGNLTVAALDGLGAPPTGDGYGVLDAGTLTVGSLVVAVGDTVQFNGSVWKKITVGVGGFIDTGVRLIANQVTSLIAPIGAGDEGKIAKFDGLSNTPAILETRVNGEHTAVRGTDAVERGNILTFNGVVPAGTWDPGTGVSGTGASPQVAFWSGTTSIKGDADFTYDETDDRLNFRQFRYTGIITDTLAADTDDYAPTGLARAGVVRITLSAAGINMTGLTGGIDGRVLALENVDATQTLTINDEDVASAAANRFALPNGIDTRVRPQGAVYLMYHGSASRWKIISEATD